MELKQINIKAKVKSVKPIKEKIMTRSGKLVDKQEATLADSEGGCRCVLWDKNVGRLSIDESYKLSNVVMKMYDGAKWAEKSLLEDIQDIGEVDESWEETLCGKDAGRYIRRGEIIGVLSCEEFVSCKSCKG